MKQLCEKSALILGFLCAPAYSMDFSAGASAEYPMFFGITGSVFLEAPVEFQASLGIVPSPFYKSVASLVRNFSGNDSYGDFVEAAFDENFLMRVGSRYHFQDRSGSSVGLNYTLFKASGRADIQQVLELATGRSFENLINLLEAAGRDTSIELSGFHSLLELDYSYSFQITPSQLLWIKIGIAKVFGSELSLSTGLPNFERSQAGKTLLNGSEEDLESILWTYGYLPSLGLGYQYLFN